MVSLSIKSVLVLCIFFVLFSCGRPSSNAGEVPQELKLKLSEPAPHDRTADDVGRFLSGMPGRDNSSFKSLENLEPWDVHRRQLDLLWRRVEGQWIPSMREFQRNELSGSPIDNSLLFYPFSGPDILMASVFFPNSPVYVMVGLEPAGTLPAPKHLSGERLPSYLAELRDSVSSELERSFFITREMDREFRGQVTDGLFPPILLLLVRSHHTVLGYRYVRLDADGRIIERPADYKATGRIGNKGIQIDFRNDEDQLTHTLFDFSVNLSDERLKENKAFLTFLHRLEGMVTFFKATSYMPHAPAFSIIRDRILSTSSAILQDDSGLPYQSFDAARWKIQLYGSYDRPYGSFRWLEQPDLKKAYATSRPKSLNFHIGYGFSQIPSNLLLAKRRL